MRRWWWIVVVSALLAGIWWWSPWKGEAPPPPETVQVARGNLRVEVSALGTLQPLQFVDVGTQVTGQLRKLHVAIGQAVKRGDLIAEIDPTLFESRVGQTTASIGSLQAQLADRRAQQMLAEQRVERNRSLMGSDAVSRQELEASEAALQQGQAGVRAIEAQIRQQSAALNFDRTNLRYTKIYAPIDGTVVSITARQGQTLVAAQQAPVILRIADLGTMTVQAQVSEADISRIGVGLPASFNTLGLPERRWSGRVRQVLPTPETVNNVILFNVLFDVANPDGVLLPQMSAQVSFLLAEAEDTLVIPARALLPKAGKRKPGKDPGTKDAAARQKGGQESGGKDPGTKDAAAREKGGQNAGGKDKGAAGKQSAEAPAGGAQADRDQASREQRARAAASDSASGPTAGAAALVPRTRKAKVEVLENGKPVERSIELGLETRNELQVLAGLRQGETLVLPPQKSEGKGGKGKGGGSGGGLPKVKSH